MFDDEVQEITDDEIEEECNILPDMTEMVQCDMCGEMYIPEPDDLLPFCDNCMPEQL